MVGGRGLELLGLLQVLVTGLFTCGCAVPGARNACSLSSGFSFHVCSVASVTSDSLQLYGLQPTSLLCPWDSPGKNTGMGRRAFLQLLSPFSSVAQSCRNLCDPMDCSTPSFPVHHQLRERAQTPIHPVGDAIWISSSVVPFSSGLQSFPASGSFPMS